MDIKRKDTSVGFEQLYIPGDPDPEGEPKKKPYLVLKLSNNNENIKYFEEMNITKLENLGLIAVENGVIVITITSNRKVINAINLLLMEDNYALDVAFREKLEELKKECNIALSQKVITPPKKSKSKSEFELSKSTNTVLDKSSSLTTVVKKKNKPDEYVFKQYESDRTISEIEAFNSFCYQLLLGKRHPKMRSVLDKKGNRIGLVSKMIPGFQSIEKYCKNTKTMIDKDIMLSSEIVKVWVAAYCEEEADLHAGNYGFDKDMKAVKIDNDRSSWPLTSKYAGVDPLIGDGNYVTPPASAFVVTAIDLNSFPILKVANPFHWVTRGSSRFFFDSKVLIELFKEKKFIDDKNYIFLKRILIDKAIYQNIAKATLSSSKIQEKHASHKHNKTVELEAALVNIPEFKEYIIENPNVIEQIICDFEEYNQSFKSQENAYLKVDLDKVIEKFYKILGDMCLNDMSLMPSVISGLQKLDSKILDKVNKLPENHSFALARDNFIFIQAYEKAPLSVVDVSSLVAYFQKSLFDKKPDLFFQAAPQRFLYELKEFIRSVKAASDTLINNELSGEQVKVLAVIMDDYHYCKGSYDVASVRVFDALVDVLNSTSSLSALKNQRVATTSFSKLMEKAVSDYAAYSHVMFNKTDESVKNIKSAADFILARYFGVLLEVDSVYAPNGKLERAGVNQYLKDECHYSASQSLSGSNKK